MVLYVQLQPAPLARATFIRLLRVCVSGFGVGQLASSRVCCSFVVCGSVREWRVLGSILVGLASCRFCVLDFPNSHVNSYFISVCTVPLL